jgi:hypothetical protein
VFSFTDTYHNAKRFHIPEDLDPRTPAGAAAATAASATTTYYSVSSTRVCNMSFKEILQISLKWFIHYCQDTKIFHALNKLFPMFRKKSM